MAGTLLVSDMHVPKEMITKDIDSGYLVDGVKVSRNLFMFCKELRRHHAFKQCLFGVDAEWLETNTNESVWVYAADELFARGKVGYGDVGVEAILSRFYVETEQIRNYKVKTQRRQFNMLSSENIDRMVVAAKKHLRPYPVEKIVDLTAYKLTSSLSAEKDSTSNAERAAMSTLQSMLSRNGLLTAELINMVRVGYDFKDSTAKDAIAAYMETIDDDIEVGSRNISIALVLVHPPYAADAEHIISVQRGQHHLNLKKRVFVTDVERAFNCAPVEKFSPETLPDDIKQKISSLNILEINSYVDGLGLRQSENIYYIAEDA